MSKTMSLDDVTKSLEKQGLNVRNGYWDGTNDIVKVFVDVNGRLHTVTSVQFDQDGDVVVAVEPIP